MWSEVVVLLVHFDSTRNYLPTYLPVSFMHISAPAVWLVRIFQTEWSWAAISASSTDHPSHRLRRSLWMTSVQIVLGCPRLCRPWVWFQRYSLFGILSLSILRRWPNHFNLRFLMIFDSWGCLVRDLMCSFEMCWDQTICRILGRHRISNASNLGLSLSVRVQDSAAYSRVDRTQAWENFIFMLKLM